MGQSFRLTRIEYHVYLQWHGTSNVTKNINVIMNEFYDYGRAKCLNILVHNKLICLYGSKVANCHFQY